jgi:hypothetical protein
MKAPGCLGSVQTFSFIAKACAACAHFEPCRSQVRERIASLPIRKDVRTELLNQHRAFDALRSHATGSTRTEEVKATVLGGKRELTAAEKKIMASLPVKAQKQYARLVAGGYVPKVKSAVESRANPFDKEGFRYLHVAFAALLEGGFTKKGLRERYMRELEWSEGTAFSHVSQIWHLLPAIGAAQEEAGMLVVHPTLCADN